MQTGAAPEQIFWNWFTTLPLWQRHALAYLYYLMTSSRSDDFAMNGAESLRRFQADLHATDFPIRRVARLLSVRAVFGFLYTDTEFARRFVLTRVTEFAGNPVQIADYQWVRDAQNWKRLCATGLSDRALHSWLATVTD